MAVLLWLQGRSKAFAEKFADEGHDLILVTRNEQKLKQQQAALQETYHVAVRYIAQDLTQESAAGLIMADIDKWKVTIDVHVNNAGFNEFGFFVDTSLDRELVWSQSFTVSVKDGMLYWHFL